MNNTGTWSVDGSSSQTYRLRLFAETTVDLDVDGNKNSRGVRYRFHFLMFIGDANLVLLHCSHRICCHWE
jgi:hypothetical protein